MTPRAARGATVVCLTASILAASPALARDEYPGEVQAALGMECPPACRTCHIQATGGKNWNAFGIQFLVPLTQGKGWPELLASQRERNVDTDLDGRPDVYELEHDTDPSVASNDRITCVRYGCGARIAGDAPVDPLAAGGAVGGLAMLLLLRARSRRRG